MNTVELRVVRLPHAVGLALPAYQSADAAGLDLVAAVPAGAPLVIPPGGRAAIPTGLAFALPRGVEGQIRPRSGLALRHGVTVLNSPGTLDPDYRGEVHVILANFGTDPFPVARGTRIAFDSDQGNHPAGEGIYTMNATDGSNLTRVTANPYGYFDVHVKFPGSGYVRLAWKYPSGDAGLTDFIASVPGEPAALSSSQVYSRVTHIKLH